MYPGYRHARTMGNVLGKSERTMKEKTSNEEENDDNSNNNSTDHDKRRGWKGEDRKSRMYAFVLTDGVDVTNRKRKRDAGNGYDSDDESSSD